MKPKLALAPRPPDTCSTCMYYNAPGADKQSGGGFLNLGRCRRFPATESKDAADWCGEHRRF